MVQHGYYPQGGVDLGTGRLSRHCLDWYQGEHHAVSPTKVTHVPSVVLFQKPTTPG